MFSGSVVIIHRQSHMADKLISCVRHAAKSMSIENFKPVITKGQVRHGSTSCFSAFSACPSVPFYRFLLIQAFILFSFFWNLDVCFSFDLAILFF